MMWTLLNPTKSHIRKHTKEDKEKQRKYPVSEIGSAKSSKLSVHYQFLGINRSLLSQ